MLKVTQNVTLEKRFDDRTHPCAYQISIRMKHEIHFDMFA